MQVYNSTFRTKPEMNFQQNPAAYIYERKSIRQFRSDSIPADLLDRIHEWASGAQGLDQSHQFIVEIHDYDTQDKRSQAVGGFGRIMSPPHFLVPYLIGGKQALIDLGFRTQQIVLEMWRHGIGSCYIGCVHRQKRVKKALGLPPEAAIAAFIAFGVPDWNQPERLFRQISHLFTHSNRRKTFRDLFLDSGWQEVEIESSILRHVLEAGRYAPSAMNTQPWRFRIEDRRLAVFAKISDANRIYDHRQDYPLHDAGICMANMSMAARVWGSGVDWELSKDQQLDVINNKQVIRIADIPIEGLRRKIDQHKNQTGN
jgi:nitroreductase